MGVNVQSRRASVVDVVAQEDDTDHG